LAQRVWRFSKENPKLDDILNGAKRFLPRVKKHPRTRKTRRGHETHTRIFDSSFPSRVATISNWWDISREPCFAEAVGELLDAVDDFDFFWNEGMGLPKLISLFNSSEGFKDMPRSEHFSKELEAKLLREIACSQTDELVSLIESVQESFDDGVPFSIETAIADSIREELEYVDGIAASYESQDDLGQYQGSILELGKLTGFDVSNAVSTINDRVLELLSEEVMDEEDVLSVSNPRGESERFEDDEIYNLFSTLR